MIFPIFTVIAAVFAQSVETQIADSQTASLEYLCARYDTLSAQMTADFVATQPSLEKEAAGENLVADIKAQSRYTTTSKELKEVVRQLGTRECPEGLDTDFPALL